jgi:hypothetical protein
LTEREPWPLSMRPGVALALGFAFLLSRLLTPAYLDNEMVYSLGSIMLTRPGLLTSQPILAEMVRISDVYNYLTAPVYFLLGSFWATVVLRLVLAAFQLWALSRLTRALGLAPWALVVLLLLWLNAEQTLAAGENVIGGASTKQIGYGFVFLALAALVRRDWRLLPVWCGLATCFHVLVGGWTTLAIGLTLLVAEWPALGWRGMLRFGVVAGVLALPAVVPALWSVGAPTTASADEVAQVYVAFANPFHLDPWYFLSPGEAMKSLVVAVAGILLIRRFAAGAGRTHIPLFLGGLALFFAVGLVARAAEAYGVLRYYPFRVADSMLPLMFWVGVTLLFQHWYAARPRVWRLLAVPIVIGLANWLIDRTETTPQYDGARGFVTAMSRTEPRMTAYHVRTHAVAWAGRFRGERDAMSRLEEWARSSTEADAVFITPPWEIDWHINAERATWASFKVITAGPSVLEWKSRLEGVHGEPFEGVGFELLRELRQSYPALTLERVRKMASQGRADYLVALNEVPGLPMVHREGPYRVYRLEEGF